MDVVQPPDRASQECNWQVLVWAFLFFGYFSGLQKCLLMFSGAGGFASCRHSVMVSTLWLIPLLLWPNRTRLISAIVGIVLWSFSLINLGYFCIYHQEFSQSAIFIISESNFAESSEFVAQYFHWWMIPVVLVYTAPAVLLWRRLRPVHLDRKVIAGLVASFMYLLFIYPNARQLRSLKFSPVATAELTEAHFGSAVPWQIVFDYLRYRGQMAAVHDMLERNEKRPSLRHFTDTNPGLPATLVLIIGESTNRQHMSLYGYPRPTTPRLDAMRTDLAIFTQVASPYAYTLGSLQQVLTFADQDHPDWALTHPSIIDLMKQARYKTFWITNQLTVAQNNTLMTYFSQLSDGQIYLHNNRIRDSLNYDGAVLEPFRRILADPAGRKFIVVHLLGTHLKYERRYPSEYDVFRDRQGLPDWVTGKQLQVINSYDNAMRYNDFVVSQLIREMASSHANGFLAYLSDHGEDVFDSPGHSMLGHDEDVPTVPMYTVPLVLWTSRRWKATHPRDFTRVLDRPYNASFFIHTWADLAGLRFDGFEPSKSLVNAHFKERPLLVGNTAVRKQLRDLRAQAPAGRSGGQANSEHSAGANR